MARLTLHARGPARSEVAWRRYVEPRRWSTWSPQVRGVDYPHSRLQEQTCGRVRGPWCLSVLFRVEEVDEAGQSWSWTVWPQVAGRAVTEVRLEHRVAPSRDATSRSRRGNGPTGRAAEGCTTWLRLHGRAPVLLAYVPVAWIALRRLVR